MELARPIGVSAVLLSAVTIAVPIVHRMDRTPGDAAASFDQSRDRDTLPGLRRDAR